MCLPFLLYLRMGLLTVIILSESHSCLLKVWGGANNFAFSLIGLCIQNALPNLSKLLYLPLYHVLSEQSILPRWDHGLGNEDVGVIICQWEGEGTKYLETKGMYFYKLYIFHKYPIPLSMGGIYITTMLNSDCL